MNTYKVSYLVNDQIIHTNIIADYVTIKDYLSKVIELGEDRLPFPIAIFWDVISVIDVSYLPEIEKVVDFVDAVSSPPITEEI
jgi:hypothetical protein